MKPFENRRVLITGSGRGIGKAVTHRFAREGAKIQLLALTSEVRATALDLRLPDSARQIVGEVADVWGGLDILVTDAGAAAQGGFLELEADAWQTGFGLKTLANLRVIKRDGVV